MKCRASIRFKYLLRFKVPFRACESFPVNKDILRYIFVIIHIEMGYNYGIINP